MLRTIAISGAATLMGDVTTGRIMSQYRLMQSLSPGERSASGRQPRWHALFLACLRQRLAC